MTTGAHEVEDWARFDDFRTGSALVCAPARRVVCAWTPAEVPGALAAVERATRDGAWAFGYLAYEAAPGLDPDLVTHQRDPDDPPLLWFGLGDPPARAAVLPRAGGGYRTSPWRPDWRPAEHRERVRHIRDRIAAGETYQCNLTERLRATVEGDPLALYADLAAAQQAGQAAYLDTGRFVVASASPELFFEWRGDRLTMRPMKGTARRGRDRAEDRELARALRASEKERAENLMIVDLMRNDAGRVSVPGSVTVSRLFSVERYPTVLQMTSEVTARPAAGSTLTQVLGALFPCGSVTGAPKPATMRLIRRLEGGPRGVYCGAIGLIAPPSAQVRARFTVPIRTVVVDRENGSAVYGVGGGITWSSDAEAEHDELMVKTIILKSNQDHFELIETMAFEPATGIRNLDRHLARLERSASYFGFVFDEARIRAELDSPIVGRDPVMVRLTVGPDGTPGLGTTPLPAPPAGPIRLAIDSEPVDSRTPWLYHKTTRRDVYTVRRARHPRMDDVILVNERNEVTESTIANLAVRLEGRWWTPPLRSGCLPGIGRERLLDLGTLCERVLRPEDVERADSLALVSSVRGWRTAELGKTHS